MTPVALVLLGCAVLVRRYRRRARLEVEPSELLVAPLDVDIQSHEEAETAQDLAALELEVDRIASAGDDAGLGEVELVRSRRHPDDDAAVDEGQNWVEALETSAVENGPEPERELDDIDDDRLTLPHASNTGDRPVADHGAGGTRGL